MGLARQNGKLASYLQVGGDKGFLREGKNAKGSKERG